MATSALRPTSRRGIFALHAKHNHNPLRCDPHRRDRLRIGLASAPTSDRSESWNRDRIAASGEDSGNGETRRIHSTVPRSQAGEDLPGDPARLDSSV